ncbi:MAG TPA: FHA domain-containing protein, partial [Elusimicrobiota bacterium]|nr:FHA domain-containing protein [Elusimicrobiota bacterium]
MIRTLLSVTPEATFTRLKEAITILTRSADPMMKDFGDALIPYINSPSGLTDAIQRALAKLMGAQAQAIADALHGKATLAELADFRQNLADQNFSASLRDVQTADGRDTFVTDNLGEILGLVNDPALIDKLSMRVLDVNSLLALAEEKLMKRLAHDIVDEAMLQTMGNGGNVHLKDWRLLVADGKYQEADDLKENLVARVGGDIVPSQREAFFKLILQELDERNPLDGWRSALAKIRSDQLAARSPGDPHTKPLAIGRARFAASVAEAIDAQFRSHLGRLPASSEYLAIAERLGSKAGARQPDEALLNAVQDYIQRELAPHTFWIEIGHVREGGWLMITADSTHLVVQPYVRGASDALLRDLQQEATLGRRNKTSWIVGRSPQTDLPLDDQIFSDGSRSHLRIWRDERGDWHVSDLQSTFGSRWPSTFSQGRIYTKPLKAGDDVILDPEGPRLAAFSGNNPTGKMSSFEALRNKGRWGSWIADAGETVIFAGLWWIGLHVGGDATIWTSALIAVFMSLLHILGRDPDLGPNERGTFRQRHLSGRVAYGDGTTEPYGWWNGLRLAAFFFLLSAVSFAGLRTPILSHGGGISLPAFLLVGALSHIAHFPVWNRLITPSRLGRRLGLIRGTINPVAPEENYARGVIRVSAQSEDLSRADPTDAQDYSDLVWGYVEEVFQTLKNLPSRKFRFHTMRNKALENPLAFARSEAANLPKYKPVGQGLGADIIKAALRVALGSAYDTVSKEVTGDNFADFDTALNECPSEDDSHSRLQRALDAEKARIYTRWADEFDASIARTDDGKKASPEEMTRLRGLYLQALYESLRKIGLTAASPQNWSLDAGADLLAWAAGQVADEHPDLNPEALREMLELATSGRIQATARLLTHTSQTMDLARERLPNALENVEDLRTTIEARLRERYPDAIEGFYLTGDGGMALARLEADNTLRVGAARFSPDADEHTLDGIAFHFDPERRQWTVRGGYDRDHFVSRFGRREVVGYQWEPLATTNAYSELPLLPQASTDKSLDHTVLFRYAHSRYRLVRTSVGEIDVIADTGDVLASLTPGEQVLAKDEISGMKVSITVDRSGKKVTLENRSERPIGVTEPLRAAVTPQTPPLISPAGPSIGDRPVQMAPHVAAGAATPTVDIKATKSKAREIFRQRLENDLSIKDAPAYILEAFEDAFDAAQDRKTQLNRAIDFIDRVKRERLMYAAGQSFRKGLGAAMRGESVADQTEVHARPSYTSEEIAAKLQEQLNQAQPSLSKWFDDDGDVPTLRAQGMHADNISRALAADPTLSLEEAVHTYVQALNDYWIDMFRTLDEQTTGGNLPILREARERRGQAYNAALDNKRLRQFFIEFYFPNLPPIPFARLVAEAYIAKVSPEDLLKMGSKESSFASVRAS